jgi:AhpD family alkylhydroperoxidase
MEKRINIEQLEPEAYKAMYGLGRYLSTGKLTIIQQNLIKIRASQINGCAFCLNMHTKEARKAGETEQRIYLLNAWREVTLFTEEEKAILELTEEVTLISSYASVSAYRKAAALFDEHYLAQIIMAIATINAWNRIAISTHLQPE